MSKHTVVLEAKLYHKRDLGSNESTNKLNKITQKHVQILDMFMTLHEEVMKFNEV